MRIDWYSVIGGAVGGGLLLKFFELLVIWARERREQRSHKTSREKDRPRFRIDATEVEGIHPNRPIMRVEILSLGSLPLTINDGYVKIEPIEYPGAIQPEPLAQREIGPNAPIVIEREIALKFLQPMSIRERYTVKLICKFSYGGDKPYENEKRYNRETHKFEDLH